MFPEHILVVHNYYQQPGGEDRVFAAETALLEQHGHRVSRFTAHNDILAGVSPLALARVTLWNSTTWRELRAYIRRERPDIVHFHNTFPFLSPAVYDACKDAGLPVVQTLHNYRLICPNALLSRNQRPCHDCVGKHTPWPGVIHACYRSSRLQTAGVAAMLAFHRWRTTWLTQVDCFIALSEFARQQFIAGGLPAAHVVVKPNFVHPDPGTKTGPGQYALVVGRLSQEKGIHTLVQAWRSGLDFPLKIVGDGPLMPEVRQLVHEHHLHHIELLGQRPHQEILSLLKGARFLVFPSEVYENFPLAIAEAFACQVPIIASRLGSMAEIITDGCTGLLFEPFCAEDLAAKATWLWNNPDLAEQFGKAARAAFEAHYTAAINYHQLLTIYQTVSGR